MQCIWFFNVKHTKIDFGRLKLGVIFTFKTPCTSQVKKEDQELYLQSYFA